MVQQQRCLKTNIGALSVLRRKTVSYAEDNSDESNPMTLQERRLLISYYYVQVLNAPKRKHWYGKDGTIGKIARGLDLPAGYNKTVESVLDQTHKCLEEAVQYMGKFCHRGGRELTIKPDSEEEQILAQYKDKGCSFTEVKDYINNWRGGNGITEAIT